LKLRIGVSGINQGQQELSLSPMEWSKCVGQHERHDQYARRKDKHVPGITQIEAADTTDEQIADGKVEEAP
jgi:hypothetical protein